LILEECGAAVEELTLKEEGVHRGR
jgi:hypothetical protein